MARPSTQHVAAGIALSVAALALVFLLLSAGEEAPAGAGPEEALANASSESPRLEPPARDGPLADTEVVEDTPPPERAGGASANSAPTDPSAPARAGWRARVRTPAGRAVAEAEVQWLDPMTEARRFLARADHEGRVALDALPPDGVLEISAAGHASQIVAPEPGDEAVIVLLPRRTVLGDVVAAEDRAPLAGAVVVAESLSWRGRAETDAGGRFQLEPPEGEPINLFVSYPQRVGRVCDEADGLTIALERGRAVRGTLSDARGRGLPGEVFIYGASQLTTPQRATADAQGGFEVWGIAPDEEVAGLAFAAEGATPLELAWEPAHTESLALTVLPRGRLVLVRAPREGALSLQRLNAPAGLPPLPEAEAVVDPTGGAEAAQLVWTLAAGSYQLALDGRPRGPVIPVASADTVRLSWRDDVLELEAAVEPPPAGNLRVQVLVLDAQGQGVADATVVASVGGHEQVVRSDERGEAVFDALPEQPLTFSASQAGKVLLRSEFVDPAEQQGEHVVLTLAEPVSLSGQVVPARPAELRLTLPDDDELVAEARARDDGSFELHGLVPLSYQLTVSAEDRLPVTLQLSLPLSGPLRVELEEDPRAHHDHHHEGEE